MKEIQTLNLASASVTEISRAINDEGEIWGMRLSIQNIKTYYNLHVGTPEYIEKIRAENKKEPDADLKTSDLILPVPNIENLETVVARISEMPPENVWPYLEEVKDH